MYPSILLLLSLFSYVWYTTARNTAVFIEPSYINSNDTPILSRISTVINEQGGKAFQILSMISWIGDFSPNETNPLPPPDSFTVNYLEQGKANTSNLLQVWGGVSLCPGPEYSCMLNYTLSNITGQQLAMQIMNTNLDGVMIYVSPYCNNANCKKETGKYAIGIANIISSFRYHTNYTKDIALLSNEWDNTQIIAQGGPKAIFSYQTVFYFTSITDCQSESGKLCGAGENVAYIEKAKANYTTILTYLNDHKVQFLGQLQGASTNATDNPVDYWSALMMYTAPSND